MRSIFLSIMVYTIWGSGFAQSIRLYKPLPESHIKVETSNNYPGFPGENTINGSGMHKDKHATHHLGEKMWLALASDSLVSGPGASRSGKVWIQYEFEKATSIDLIQIWNFNQDNHLERGLRKVYIQVSNDGKNWEPLDKEDFYIIPKSRGRNLEPSSLTIKLENKKFKYFLITAHKQEGNYYYDGSQTSLKNAKLKNQNPDFYGLSEINFFKETTSESKDIQIEDFEINVAPAYRKTDEGPSREFTINFDQPLYSGGSLLVVVNNRKKEFFIPETKRGLYEFTAVFPPGIMEEESKAKISFQSPQGEISKNIAVEGARKWEVDFLPHSHLDIGYTHHHNEVLKLQMQNIDSAINLIKATQSFPRASQFKWNIETMWPVLEYLKKADQEKFKTFKTAVKEGKIGLNAGLGNILTGLSTSEELIHVFDDGISLGESLGIKTSSVMVSDVPGVSWGFVNAMAARGLKYLSLAPNYVPHLFTGGSRVGLSHVEWGDKPFYWETPSGEEKVLCWSAGKGYSFFHDWLAGRLAAAGTETVWEYLETLEDKDFPYDIAYLRYTVNGDNGPPDNQISEIISNWNERYEYPKFRINTTDSLFARFEKRYAKQIPSYKGDFTPYWEDGAASTARELKLNRKNSEYLSQLEILSSLIDPKSFPEKEINSAWRNIVLFSEHTWGAAASGTDPDANFVEELWEEKAQFVKNSDSIIDQIEKSLNEFLNGQRPSATIRVYNTNTWENSDVVRLQTSQNLNGKVLRENNGRTIPIQALNDSTWVFSVKDIPPLGFRDYKIVQQVGGQVSNGVKHHNNILSNENLEIEVSPTSGNIIKLFEKSTSVDYAGGKGLNQYVYSGRNAADVQFLDSLSKPIVKTTGPVFSELKVTSTAPGIDSLTRKLRLFKGINKLEIQNSIYKKRNYDYENIRFAFPFNIQNRETIIDIPFNEITPERDQLAGANKNYFSSGRGVSVQGIKQGIFLGTLTTPFLELEAMTGEKWLEDSEEFLAWKRGTASSSTLYSWVMNNSWRTNYKAYQEGKISFEYVLEPLNYRTTTKKIAANYSKPLRAFFVTDEQTEASMFAVPNAIEASTISPLPNGEGFQVRLNNLRNQTTPIKWHWNDFKPDRIVEIINGKQTEQNPEVENWLKPYQSKTFILIKN